MSLLNSSDRVSKSVYEKHAGFYDNCPVINNYLERWDEEVIRLSPETPLLDIGCGPGRLIHKFAGSGFRDVAGVDVTLRGLHLAKGKFAQSQLDAPLALCEALAVNLPFRENSFATIVFSGVLHHLEKPTKALDESWRILKERGTLIIADPYFPPLMRHFINAVLSIYPITGDRRFYTASKMTSLARGAGFRKKKMINMPLAYILVFEKCSSSEL
jgi:ubiquinone/menaquinone biosynthesis C-methylase UbiE